VFELTLKVHADPPTPALERFLADPTELAQAHPAIEVGPVHPPTDADKSSPALVAFG
jgi:hypothetical protein